MLISLGFALSTRPGLGIVMYVLSCIMNVYSYVSTDMHVLCVYSKFDISIYLITYL